MVTARDALSLSQKNELIILRSFRVLGHYTGSSHRILFKPFNSYPVLLNYSSRPSIQPLTRKLTIIKRGYYGQLSFVHDQFLVLLRPSIRWLRRRRPPPSSGPRGSWRCRAPARSRQGGRGTPPVAAVHLVPHLAFRLHPHRLRLPRFLDQLAAAPSLSSAFESEPPETPCGIGSSGHFSLLDCGNGGDRPHLGRLIRHTAGRRIAHAGRRAPLRAAHGLRLERPQTPRSQARRIDALRYLPSALSSVARHAATVSTLVVGSAAHGVDWQFIRYLMFTALETNLAAIAWTFVVFIKRICCRMFTALEAHK